MAAIDVAGYVSALKAHAEEHGFHIHDERHFIETYSLRQAWEVSLHPEEGCDGPIDLHLTLDIDPRVLLDFEAVVAELPPDEMPPDKYHFPLGFFWALPPLGQGPDLLVLTTELAARSGPDLELEVSAIDSYPSAMDAPTRSLNVAAHRRVSLARIFDDSEDMCETLDRCRDVSLYLLERVEDWA
jgi:hypothetical protein